MLSGRMIHFLYVRPSVRRLFSAALSIGLLAIGRPSQAQDDWQEPIDRVDCGDGADPWVCEDFESSPVGAFPDQWLDLADVVTDQVEDLAVVKVATGADGKETHVLEITSKFGVCQGIYRHVQADQKIYMLRADVYLVQDMNRADYDNLPIDIAFAIYSQADPYSVWPIAGTCGVPAMWDAYSGYPLEQKGFGGVFMLERWYRFTMQLNTTTGTHRTQIIDLASGAVVDSGPITFPTLIGRQFDTVFLANQHRGTAGSEGITLIDNIIISEAAGIFPHSEFSLPETPDGCMTPGLEFLLDGSISTTPEGSTIATYAWDFGDGGTAQGPTARHAYARPGLYTVTLMVMNDGGWSDTTWRRICVAEPPVDPASLAPWTAIDVGGPRFPGCSRKDGEWISIYAGGTLLSGKVDKLHFAYQEFTGDFDSAVRVDEVEGTPSAQLGLMARESLDPGAVMAAMAIATTSTSNYFRFFSRTATDTNCTMKMGTKTVLPAWLRLRRKGDTVTGYASADGWYWSVVHSMELKASPGKLLVGIFGSGREPTDDSSFEPLEARICIEGSPPPPFRRGDANADGTSDISDAVFILRDLFLGGTRAVTCEKSADTNDDGALDIADGIYLLEFLFRGGMAPPQPLEDCGMDPTKDDLTCDSFARC